jgi:hypothetical protein
MIDKITCCYLTPINKPFSSQGRPDRRRVGYYNKVNKNFIAMLFAAVAPPQPGNGDAPVHVSFELRSLAYRRAAPHI